MRPIEELIKKPEYIPGRKAMRKAARRVLVEASEPYPDSVLHFTDMNGLIGIITSKKLWASYAHALNDENEILCGVVAARDSLSTLTDRSQQFLLKSCLEALNFKSAAHAIGFSPYIVSFCAEESSAHWLHYGHSGSGVAVAFWSAGLVTHPGAGFYRVIYESEDQRKIIKNIVVAVYEEFQRLVAADPHLEQGLVETAIEIAQTYLMIAVSLMKERHFVGENEWRLVHIRKRLIPEEQVSDVLFRSSCNRVRPYVEIGFPLPFPYQKTILGYSCPEAEDSPSLRAFFWEQAQMQVESFARSAVRVRP